MKILLLVLVFCNTVQVWLNNFDTINTVDCPWLKLFPFKKRIHIFDELKNCFKNRNNSVFTTVKIFLFSKIMATLRNKRKLAATAGKTQDYLWHNQSQNATTPGLTEDYIAQVSEKIEGRVTKKLFHEFRRIKSRILGAPFKSDKLLLNPQMQTFSGTTPGTFRNTDVENHEPSGDRSQKDPHPEVEFSACCASNLSDSDPNETSHMVKRVQGEIPNCSLGTFSGKQKKARCTSQPQVRSDNTPAKIEADQILLALQQLASNSNSVNFNNNINTMTKLPKSVTTTMPIFDGRSEKIELFENMFQTSINNHHQPMEENRIHYLHSLMRGDALQTFKNISSPRRENLAEIQTVFRRKYVKTQSMTTAKHKFQRLDLNPANRKLFDLLDELQKLAKEEFGVASQAKIEQFKYAKVPPHLKKSINQGRLENDTYKHIVSHLEGELGLNGLETPDEMQINTVTQQATKPKIEKPKPTCHHWKQPGRYRNQCRQLKKERERDQTDTNKNNAGNNTNSHNNSGQTNSNAHNNKTVTNGNVHSANHRNDRKPKTVYSPCETCGKTNHST